MGEAIRRAAAGHPWLRGLLLLLLLAPFAPAAAAAVVASVDRNEVDISESFELRITSSATRVLTDPDLDVLGRDFDVLGMQQSNNISITNGSTESTTEWRITLMAKRPGTLRIPPITVGREQTAAIMLRVTAGAGRSRGTDEDVQLELEVDHEIVHVQQQIVLLVRVLHAVNFAGGASLAEPEIDGALVRRIGEHSYAQMRGGRQYGVFERRYAIFPQQSGLLRIPALGFEARTGGSSVFDPFGARGHVVRLRTEEKIIDVKPPEAGASPWLPARLLTLVETWDKSPQELRVGDSATRTISIRADGLTGAQLPPLALPAIDGLRFYPDKPAIGDEPGEEGIRGTRAESVAVIPTAAGDYVFPELRVRWWDTVNQRFDEAMVPAQTIRVLPAAGTPAAPPARPAPGALAPPAAQDSTAVLPANAGAPAASGAEDMPPPSPANRWWMLATALFALTTVLAALQWWRLARRLRAPPPPALSNGDEPALFEALRAVCARADAAALTPALTAWARRAFPRASIRTTAEFERIANDAELSAALAALLASRYGTAPAAGDGARLLARLEALRARATARAATAADGLPPLYAR